MESSSQKNTDYYNNQKKEDNRLNNNVNINQEVTITSAGENDYNDGVALLSRSTLYTPLRAYNQSIVEPYQYLHQFQKIPKAIHEQSVSEFLHDISIHYHQYPASYANKQQHQQQHNEILSNNNNHHYNNINLITNTIGLDCKNCSAKPLSESDITKSIESKAITLIGGGYNSTPSKKVLSSSKIISGDPILIIQNNEKRLKLLRKHCMKRNHKIWKKQNINNNKQKMIQRKNSNRTNQSCTNNETITTTEKEDNLFLEMKHVIEFIKELNHKWNHYLTNILSIILENQCKLYIQKQSLHNKTENIKNNNMQFIQDYNHLYNIIMIPINQLRLEQLEYIGAQIHIKESQSMKNYINKKGILIGCTSQTYEVLFFAERNSNPITCNNQNTSKELDMKFLERSHDQHDHVYYYIQVIPKKGTSIKILLPIHEDLVTKFFIIDNNKDNQVKQENASSPQKLLLSITLSNNKS